MYAQREQRQIKNRKEVLRLGVYDGLGDSGACNLTGGGSVLPVSAHNCVAVFVCILNGFFIN